MGRIGEQLIVPQGYQSLSADSMYIYLGRSGKEAHAMLCSFDPYSKNKAVYLEYLSNERFEAGLAHKKIISRPTQKPLPDWLDPIVERSADPRESFSLEAYKAKHRKSVDKRWELVIPLLDQKHKILGSEAPLRHLNRHARAIGAKESRFCFDFFVLIAYGDRWALLPLHFLKGNYKRNFTARSRKLGPKYKDKGPEFGWAINDEMRQDIYKGYDRFNGPGIFMTTIYKDTLREIFNCRTRRRNKLYEFYHPTSKPFPSLNQFRDAVYAHYGRDRVRRDRLGEQRTRGEKRPSEGSFSEQIADIAEKIEADGYYLPEVPKGERNGNLMPPLCVVRLRDLVTGIFTGIGFSIGAELADAYRMALFCMAVPKSEFGRLMGVEIDDKIWPVVGLPSWLSLDRGPGSTEKLMRDLVDELDFRDLAPSYAGQSKATIESTNPREGKVSGGPTYVQSNLTYTQLAQREILRTARDNERIDVASRRTPEMVRAGVAGNPLAIYEYLDERYRNVSKPILFEDAVRNFLTEVELDIDGTGAFLHGQLYDSDALRDSGMLNRAVASGAFKMKGYALPLSVRQVWADVNGTIVEARAKLRIRDDDRQLFLALDDLIHLDELRRAAARADAESRLAIVAEYEQQFEQLTGHKWSGGHRKSGRAKRGSAAAQQEFRDTRRVSASMKK